MDLTRTQLHAFNGTVEIKAEDFGQQGVGLTLTVRGQRVIFTEEQVATLIAAVQSTGAVVVDHAGRRRAANVPVAAALALKNEDLGASVATALDGIAGAITSGQTP